MIFEKPKGLKYTDIAIWIDDNAYQDNCDDNKLYEYIYHIIRMLSYKGRYFKSAEMYENFSMYGATRTYFRLKNKKQFELNADGVPRMNKITSILNFLKATVYPMKVDYEQQEYSQNNMSENPRVSLDDMKMDYSQIRDKVENTGFAKLNFECYLTQLAKTIKSCLVKIPEYSKKVEWNNIYLSCLLTLLNSITLTNKDKELVTNLSENLYEDKLEKLYYKESQNCVILFHLPESMNNYIFVLCNKIKKSIAKDLSEIINCYETPESITKYAILESVSRLYEDEEGD